MNLETLKEKVNILLGVDMSSKGGERTVVDARKIFTVIAIELISKNVSKIGRSINKHHVTVMHYRDSGNNLLKTDKEFRDKYNLVKNSI